MITKTCFFCVSGISPVGNFKEPKRIFFFHKIVKPSPLSYTPFAFLPSPCPLPSLLFWYPPPFLLLSGLREGGELILFKFVQTNISLIKVQKYQAHTCAPFNRSILSIISKCKVATMFRFPMNRNWIAVDFWRKFSSSSSFSSLSNFFGLYRSICLYHETKNRETFKTKKTKKKWGDVIQYIDFISFPFSLSFFLSFVLFTSALD